MQQRAYLCAAARQHLQCLPSKASKLSQNYLSLAPQVLKQAFEDAAADADPVVLPGGVLIDARYSLYLFYEYKSTDIDARYSGSLLY